MDSLKPKVSHWLKWADKIVGIPLVWVLGWFKTTPRPHSFSRIALLKTSGIGDTVLLSAIIADISAEKPDAEITLFTSHTNKAIAMLLPQLYPKLTVVVLPINAPWKAISTIRKNTFDVWLDFGPWPRINAVFSHAARAALKVGFMTKGQYRHYVYHHAVPHQQDQHEIDNYRHIAKQAGLALACQAPDLSALRPEHDSHNSQTIVIHLFSGGSKRQLKMLPVHTWVTLINQLTSLGKQIVLTGNHAEAPYIEKVRHLCQNPAQITQHNKGLSATIALLSQAAVVIAVDTGIMHLAAALQCRVLAIHGPTNPARWGGIGTQLRVVYPEISCSPCLQLGFESRCTDNQCLKQLSAQTLYQSLEGLGWV